MICINLIDALCDAISQHSECHDMELRAGNNYANTYVNFIYNNINCVVYSRFCPKEFCDFLEFSATNTSVHFTPPPYQLPSHVDPDIILNLLNEFLEELN